MLSFLGFLGAVVDLAYFGVGVVLSEDVHAPEAVEVVREGAGAYFAEAVNFGEVFYFNYWFIHEFVH